MHKKIIYVLIFLILINTVIAIEQQEIYRLALKLENNKPVLDSVVKSTGFMPDRVAQPKDGYLLELKSFEEENLYIRRFGFPILADVPYEESQGKELLMILPYFENGKEIIISKNNEILLEIDLTLFARYCNQNNVCDFGENNKYCSKDCPSGSKDDYCDKVKDNICDPDCLKTQDKDCKEEILSKNQFFLFLGIALVLIVIFILISFFYKRGGE